MNHAPQFSHALQSLESAISALEAAAARRTSQTEIAGDIGTELVLMRADRAKLGAELDAALAHSQNLDSARADVSARLEQAIATLRTILGKA